MPDSSPRYRVMTLLAVTSEHARAGMWEAVGEHTFADRWDGVDNEHGVIGSEQIDRGEMFGVCSACNMPVWRSRYCKCF